MPIVETLRQRRSTPTARRSWRSSARCRISSARTGCKWIALRYFNAAGADPDGAIGEDHAAEIHLIPLRDRRRATAAPPLKVFGEDYPTPDGTCLRDYIHVCDLADAHVRALDGARARRGRRRLQRRHRHAALGAQVIDTVERVVGPAGAPGKRRRAAPGDPAVLYASSDRAQRELGWRPQYADLETIVRHAWQWHSTHPQGLCRASYADR